MSKKSRSSNEMIPPQGLAMILCDEVWRDPATLKDFILGVFHTIEPTDFPLTFPKIAVYFVLTGGRGNIPVEFRIVDASGENDVYEADYGAISFASPLEVIERVVWLIDMDFPAPGEYRIQLLAAGNLVMERRLKLIEPDEE